jgi:hypothetical protein
MSENVIILDSIQGNSMASAAVVRSIEERARSTVALDLLEGASSRLLSSRRSSKNRD